MRVANALLTMMVLAGPVCAQEAPALVWKADWVQHPTAPEREPIVLHFRKEISVAKKPGHFVLHVSGDRRFVFYVNGQRVGSGPAIGDLNHWRYETFDVAPMLKDGANVLSAVVWNWGIYSPLSQYSDRTAFLVQGDKDTGGVADTGDAKAPWMVKVDSSVSPFLKLERRQHDYYAVGAAESFDAAKEDREWLMPAAATGGWVAVSSVARAINASQTFNHQAWRLVPDMLPAMTYDDVPAGTVVASDIPGAKLGVALDGTIVPPHTTVRIQMDRKQILTAYPELRFSGGAGSHVLVTYAEALYDANQLKGSRDAVAGRRAIGYQDEVLPDGGTGRVFEPLWWRCWRYIQLDITTGDEPLTLDAMKAHATMYPFERKATFESSDAELNRIFEIGWWTLRLNAHEEYTDTPFYEQQQYIGDTRIDSLISYAVGDDDRLAEQADEAFSASRLEGIPQSRGPSWLVQSIPPFSLYWIGMLRDEYEYRTGVSVVKDYMQATRDILGWFRQYQREDGMLKKTPGWNFVDWVPAGSTTPVFDKDGISCVLNLELLGGLQDGADLEHRVGIADVAADYDKRIALLTKAIYDNCWSARDGLMADTPEKTVFSEHAQMLASLYDVLPHYVQLKVLDKVLKNRGIHDDQEEPKGKEGLMPASYYYRFYLSRALEHAGMGDRYIESIEPWRELLSMGFTAWPEQVGDTRSDAHGFSAHPTFDLLRIVAGIAPGSAGFENVKVEPHLGSLKSLKVTYPHAKGMIAAEYAQTGGVVKVHLVLPPGLAGSFVWQGETRALRSGENRFDVPAVK